MHFQKTLSRWWSFHRKPGLFVCFYSQTFQYRLSLLQICSQAGKWHFVKDTSLMSMNDHRWIQSRSGHQMEVFYSQFVIREVWEFVFLILSWCCSSRTVDGLCMMACREAWDLSHSWYWITLVKHPLRLHCVYHWEPPRTAKIILTDNVKKGWWVGGWRMVLWLMGCQAVQCM